MKRRLYIIAFFTLLFLSACGETSTENSSGSADVQEPESEDFTKMSGNSSKVYAFPEQYNENADEKIIFKTEIVVNEKIKNAEAPKGFASRQQVDNEKIFQLFFSDIPVRDKEIYELEDDNGKLYESIYYEGENLESLLINPESFSYMGALMPYIANVFDLTENTDKYSQEQDLPFQSQEEAFQDLKKELRKADIDIGDEYKCYALDYKIMQEEEYAIDMDGNEDTSSYKPSWSQEDDCYYFIIWQKFQDVPVYQLDEGELRNADDENAPIQILYSKNGIEMMEFSKVYHFEESEEVVELKPFEEVAQTVNQKYSMLLGDMFFKVTKAELYYMADELNEDQYELMPVWIIDIMQYESEENNDGEDGSKIQEAVNAATAEEMQ